MAQLLSFTGLLIIFYPVLSVLAIYSADHDKTSSKKWKSCGLQLENSISSLAGKKGEKGPPGNSGIHGLPGTAGMKGAPGERGILGNEGPDVEDPCFNTLLKDIKREYEFYGKVCKRLEEGDTKRIMGPGDIEVNCIVDEGKKLTCIPPIISNVDTTYPSEKQPFWLSSKNVTIEKLYGLNRTQLEWFQKRSHSAFQEIKTTYQCDSSITTDIGSDLLLLSSNDMIFGPTSSERTPFTYKILASSKCSNVEGKLQSQQTIEIKTDFALRLPIVDFFVQDVEAKHKSIKIENVKLCFD